MDSTKYSKTAADAVSEVRREAGISVLALSKATAIPYTTLDRKLRGVGDLTIREAHALAAALGTSLPRLLAERVETFAA